MITEAREGLRERSKRQRVDRILTAARELLSEHPDGVLTVDRIAERAEVAPATVFNLVGTREQIWAALADQALAGLDPAPLAVADPHERARAVVDSIMRMVCAEPAVYRALLRSWSHSARMLEHDPTAEIVGCLEAAANGRPLPHGITPRRLGELVSAGIVGVLHQWAAGLIGDRALQARARDVVDVAFVLTE